ncbi:MAG: trypsin-like peptidase domain-containing protein, partial [Oscillospiraceae bacterium]|nr:trypsin-like peptidase domain-containing protein [Oscillospiraceae bacterium]
MKESAVTVYAYSDDVAVSGGQGSGFIFSEDGYIITNSHVVANGNVNYVSVRLWDNTYYSGKLIGYDVVTDIAVLKIQVSGLKPVTFGDSAQISQGEQVVAYGNPAGLTASVTSGVVSGLGRNVTLNDMNLHDCIQIDAAINPGNSGGALLNMWGQVVGVVSAKLESDDYDGIGFAISTAEAKPVIESIIEHGCVVGRVKIGIEFYEVSEEMAEGSELLKAGLLVANVDETCDIANSGLTQGDIILTIEGKRVMSLGDVSDITKDKKPGDVLKFTYWRDGAEYEAEFKLME